jgi:hypothetical protein
LYIKSYVCPSNISKESHCHMDSRSHAHENRMIRIKTAPKVHKDKLYIIKFSHTCSHRQTHMSKSSKAAKYCISFADPQHTIEDIYSWCAFCEECFIVFILPTGRSDHNDDAKCYHQCIHRLEHIMYAFKKVTNSSCGQFLIFKN